MPWFNKELPGQVAPWMFLFPWKRQRNAAFRARPDGDRGETQCAGRMHSIHGAPIPEERAEVPKSA